MIDTDIKVGNVRQGPFYRDTAGDKVCILALPVDWGGEEYLGVYFNKERQEWCAHAFRADDLEPWVDVPTAVTFTEAELADRLNQWGHDADRAERLARNIFMSVARDTKS